MGGKLPCYQELRGYKWVVDKRVDKRVAPMFSITYEKALDSRRSGSGDEAPSRPTLILAASFLASLPCPVRPLPPCRARLEDRFEGYPDLDRRPPGFFKTPGARGSVSYCG